MTYNLSFMENSTNYFLAMQGANTLTGNLFGALILLCVGLVLFIAMKRYDSKVAFLVTSFALSVIALFMFTMSFIKIQIFVIPLIMLLASVFYIVAIK